MTMKHRRYDFPPTGEQIPLHLDSIGYNHDQRKTIRPEGFPIFHWLQTDAGEGILYADDQTIKLPQYTGVLLFPNIPHIYKPISGRWKTVYLTFSGPLALQIVTSFRFTPLTILQWEESSHIVSLVLDMMDDMGVNPDFTGLLASIQIYRLLTLLKTDGQYNQQRSVSSQMNIIQPLIESLNEAYNDPSLGVEQMAAIIKVTPRHLNTLFQGIFGIAPYTYLIHLRINKAKELLTIDPFIKVNTVALRCGFRDSSHFVATFRKSVGMTPLQFRNFH